MSKVLDKGGVDILFTDAHTHYAWQPKTVPESLLHRMYEMARLGPTSANCSPLRILFLQSAASKERLRPALSKGNVGKAMGAPVVAILASDVNYVDRVPDLFPVGYDARSWFTSSPDATEQHGVRNATLQAGYLIIAARALGLDCGPMSGFDAAAVDHEFFADGDWRTFLLLNLGYGADLEGYARKPRLSVAEACRFL